MALYIHSWRRRLALVRQLQIEAKVQQMYRNIYKILIILTLASLFPHWWSQRVDRPRKRTETTGWPTLRDFPVNRSTLNKSTFLFHAESKGLLLTFISQEFYRHFFWEGNLWIFYLYFLAFFPTTINFLVSFPKIIYFKTIKK